jgi:MFS transporter, UMF1 family
VEPAAVLDAPFTWSCPRSMLSFQARPMENRREIWSWAFYDFANSAYSTTVAAVIFNTYFVTAVAADGATVLGYQIPGASLWAYAVSLSMLLAAVAAPVLGSVADFTAAKKRFLFFFSYVGAVATTLLYFVAPGDVWLGVLLFVLSNWAFEASFSFYSAFLPEITTQERMARVSGFGWALGYIGGVLCLILNMFMIQRPDWFGLAETDAIPVRASMVVVGLWWGLFAIPTFLWVRERTVSTGRHRPLDAVRAGLRRLVQTFRKAGRYRELVKYLVAFLIYNDGIQTVIVMAAVFGATELGMTQDQLIPAFIMVQLVAFFGALFFGYLGDRLPTKTAINISLVVWVGALVYVLFVDQVWEFWMLGAVVGLVMGGSQSASRALFAQFTPVANSAEFFGFFSVSGKFASIFGPILFGVTTQLTGSVRFAVVSIILFFAVGMAILYFVDERKGIREGRVPVLG